MDTSTIAVTVESISGKILDYALLLAAIGTIAMALLELIKSMTYLAATFSPPPPRTLAGDRNRPS